jgi:hypothetical protein
MDETNVPVLARSELERHLFSLSKMDCPPAPEGDPFPSTGYLVWLRVCLGLLLFVGIQDRKKVIGFKRRMVCDGERYFTGLDGDIIGGPSRIEPSSHGPDLDNLRLSSGCLVRLPGSDTQQECEDNCT